MQHVEEGLLPARALRLCWRGDFEAAHQLLAFSAGRQPTPESQALRWAEVAVYAAAAGRESSAAGAVAKAQEELAAPCESRSVEALRANLLVALALLMLGRNRQAALALSAPRPTSSAGRDGARSPPFCAQPRPPARAIQSTRSH